MPHPFPNVLWRTVIHFELSKIHIRYKRNLCSLSTIKGRMCVSMSLADLWVCGREEKSDMTANENNPIHAHRFRAINLPHSPVGCQSPTAGLFGSTRQVSVPFWVLWSSTVKLVSHLNRTVSVRFPSAVALLLNSVAWPTLVFWSHVIATGTERHETLQPAVSTNRASHLSGILNYQKHISVFLTFCVLQIPMEFPESTGFSKNLRVFNIRKYQIK